MSQNIVAGLRLVRISNSVEPCFATVAPAIQIIHPCTPLRLCSNTLPYKARRHHCGDCQHHVGAGAIDERRRNSMLHDEAECLDEKFDCNIVDLTM